MRVTHKIWRDSLMNTMSHTYERMASIDMSRRIHKPSDDPAGTEHLLRLNSMLSRNEQYQKNVESGKRWLNYSESSLGAITDGLREVRVLALSAADDSNALEGLAEQMDGLIHQIMTAANAQHGGRYLFSGGQGNTQPFEIIGNDVIYHGDDEKLNVAISNGLSLQYNVPGSDVLTTTEASKNAEIDWDPVTTYNTRLEDLFDGLGVATGMIRVTDGAGTETVVDLVGSVTLGDVRDRIQAAQPGMTVELVDGERLEVRDPANPMETIKIEDVQGGVAATALGIAGAGVGGVLISRNLDPQVTEDTLLTELRGVNNAPGSIGVSIENADPPTVLDLSAATTVGELLSIFNGAFPELNASISPSGDRLRINGSNELRFEITNAENDSTAQYLGISGEARPTRPLGTLLDLRDAIVDGDRDAIRDLIRDLELFESKLLSARASAGSRLAMTEDALAMLESRNMAMADAASEIADADMAEALMMFQSAESVYQASLMMASNIFQMGLINYL